MSFIDAHGQLYIPIVITDITVISLISLNSLKWDLAIWGPAKEILGKKGGQMAVLDKSVEEPVLSERESELVRSAQRCIMAALDHSRAGKIAILSDAEAVIDKDTPVLELPPKVLRFIAKTLGAMAEGKTILLMPKDQELTTVQAAHLLQVSRPFLSKLLKEEKIPFRMVGSHRRVSHEDLMAYKAKMREAQDLAMQDLTDQSQELGIE